MRQDIDLPWRQHQSFFDNNDPNSRPIQRDRDERELLLHNLSKFLQVSITQIQVLSSRHKQSLRQAPLSWHFHFSHDLSVRKWNQHEHDQYDVQEGMREEESLSMVVSMLDQLALWLHSRP